MNHSKSPIKNNNKQRFGSCDSAVNHYQHVNHNFDRQRQSRKESHLIESCQSKQKQCQSSAVIQRPIQLQQQLPINFPPINVNQLPSTSHQSAVNQLQMTAVNHNQFAENERLKAFANFYENLQKMINLEQKQRQLMINTEISAFFQSQQQLNVNQSIIGNVNQNQNQQRISVIQRAANINNVNQFNAENNVQLINNRLIGSLKLPIAKNTNNQ